MIQSFKNQGTEDIFNGKNTKAARKICPRDMWHIASRKFDQLDSIIFLNELRIPPGNRFEGLNGDRKDQYSIRINDQYRVCFEWSELGPVEVEIVDYHLCEVKNILGDKNDSYTNTSRTNPSRGDASRRIFNPYGNNSEAVIKRNSCSISEN